MKLLRSFAIVALALAATANLASAGDKPCLGCGHSGLGGLFGGGGGGVPPRTVFGSHKGQLPAFQAAPWYNYWPYDAHFLTPAPVGGAFYGPPMTGNFPVNPYFPAAGYGYGAQSYGFAPPAGYAPPAAAVPQPMPVAPGK